MQANDGPLRALVCKREGSPSLPRAQPGKTRSAARPGHVKHCWGTLPPTRKAAGSSGPAQPRRAGCECGPAQHSTGGPGQGVRVRPGPTPPHPRAGPGAGLTGRHRPTPTARARARLRLQPPRTCVRLCACASLALPGAGGGSAASAPIRGQAPPRPGPAPPRVRGEAGRGPPRGVGVLQPESRCRGQRCSSCGGREMAKGGEQVVGPHTLNVN